MLKLKRPEFPEFVCNLYLKLHLWHFLSVTFPTPQYNITVSQKCPNTPIQISNHKTQNSNHCPHPLSTPSAPPSNLPIFHPDICVHVHCFLLQGEVSARYLHGAGEHCLQGQGGQGDDSIHCHIIGYASVHCCGGCFHLGRSKYKH